MLTVVTKTQITTSSPIIKGVIFVVNVEDPRVTPAHLWQIVFSHIMCKESISQSSYFIL